MAIANHVGHDKRGNKTYVRDRKGNEVIEEIEELAKEWAMERPYMSARLPERKWLLVLTHSPRNTAGLGRILQNGFRKYH